MRFSRLLVQNLRAVRRFEVDDLGSFVVVAGQNGSGKSCIFDAMRLLKSVYGGYQANEYHQWFGEFGVNLQDRAGLKKVFRDPSAPISISGTVAFSEGERRYIADNASDLAEPLAWIKVTGQPVDHWSWSPAGYMAQLRHRLPEVREAAQHIADGIRHGLDAEMQHELSLVINPKGELDFRTSAPVEAAFQTYAPRHLGIIEYHSASRSYSRQQVGGINLDARAFEDQQRQFRLYNWQNKYQNIKTELAASYLRALISKQASPDAAYSDLNETLQELFQTFFPDKSYLGAQPQDDGSLDFPVRLSSGEVHDLDDLSSGEKEILYGYLRLRNSTPPNSVILLDEPELHLNPSLLHGFADFYYRRLGLDQGNQIWLVTHSDTLLRQAVGNANYRVFQMISATVSDGPANQAVEVLADDDVERVTIDLVGDLAVYRPHGKVVVLEGKESGGFDVTMVRRLFPDFARRVNLVSGGNKQRVRDLYAALDGAASSAGLKNRFYAIVDKDVDPAGEVDSATTVFSWDVYHIENYLLEPGALRLAVAGLTGSDQFSTDGEVLDALRGIASELTDQLVLVRLRTEVNDELLRAIDVGGNPATPPEQALLASVKSSAERFARVAGSLGEEQLRERSERHRAIVVQALESGAWLKEFPGRLILRRFADRVVGGKIEARLFANVVLDKMVDRGDRPEAMEAIVREIVSR